MATNEIYRDANHLSAPVPEGTKAGDPLRLGGLNCVAQTDRNEDGAANPDPVRGYDPNLNPVGNATVWMKGGHEFTVDFEVADWGTPIYITAAGALTEVATGNALYGHAISTKAAEAGPLVVRITN